jgi:phosphoglycolate phosphatase
MNNNRPDHGRTTVIFDRDGTLLDFYDMFLQFILDLHSDQGVAPPPKEKILGLEYWHSIMSSRERIGTTVVRDRIDDVVHRYMAYGRLYPGAVRTVHRLASAGVRLALVSGWVGTGVTEVLLEENGIRHAFGAIFTRDDLPGDTTKFSDEECKILLAQDSLRMVGHAPGDPLFVVGDSPADVTLSRSLNAEMVGVRTGNGAKLLAGETFRGVMVDSAADVDAIVLDGGKP